MQEDKQKMTEHFIQTLPTLLHRYSADAEKLTNLLAIPQYFDLEVYTSSRLESNLQAFLDKMGDIMQAHNDKDVLETCAKTLEFLCTEGSAIYTRCDIARSNIIDQCVNRYKEAIDDWRNLIAGEETPNEDETYNIVVSLKKVAFLYSCHNLNNPWNLFESLFEDIDECQSRTAESAKGLPDEVNSFNTIQFNTGLNANFDCFDRLWFTALKLAISRLHGDFIIWKIIAKHRHLRRVHLHCNEIYSNLCDRAPLSCHPIKAFKYKKR